MAKKTTQPKPKVDIFGVLKDINDGKRDFYTKLPEDQQKTLHPFVLTRWMSGTKNPLQLIMLNNTVNRYNFSLVSHKRLLMDMLLASGARGVRYQWKPGPKKLSSGGVVERLFKEYYQCSPKEAKMYATSNVDVETLIKMAQFLGWQDDEVTKLKQK